MLKIGIIGSGFGVYGLLPAFGLTKNCQVTAICARESPRLEKYCQKFKVKKVYADWKKLIDREKLNAVAIAVIPAAQYQIIKYALKKGLHVFAEKPLAANLQQAAELERLAKRARAITAVDFIFPEISEWVKARELLQKEKLGKLLQIKSEWDFLSYDIKYRKKSWKTDVSQGGGALSFFFSHVLYYLENFAGEIQVLNSQLAYSPKSLNGGETGVDLVFKTKNGVSGSAHLNCNAQGKNRHCVTLVYEKGKIVLENTKNVTRDFNLKIYQNSLRRKVKIKKPVLPKGLDERVREVKNLAGRFVRGCLKKQTLRPAFVEGVRVQKLIMQIRKNSKR